MAHCTRSVKMKVLAQPTESGSYLTFVCQKQKGEAFWLLPLTYSGLRNKLYCCGSNSTPSPRCMSSMAKTIMPVEVVGVVSSTRISPTARRGKAATRMLGPLVRLNIDCSVEGGLACVSSAVEALKESESTGLCRSAS